MLFQGARWGTTSLVKQGKEEQTVSKRDEGFLEMGRRAYYLNQEERRDLGNKLKRILEERKEIEFAYLYGSFIEDLPFHDVDVGIYVAGIRDSEATFYALDLAQSLSSKLAAPVDVRILNFAPVSFRYHVFRGELIWERNEELRSRIMERTMQKYFDLSPILYRSMKEAFAN
jgi:predicted nucleotidyltransferase